MNDSSQKESKAKEKKEKEKKKKNLSIIIALASLISSIPVILVVVLFITVAIVLGLIEVDNGGNGIASNNGIPSECNFTINSTPLTKAEYTSKIEEYASNHSSALIFAENASEIYDIAKNYNVNPELIIIRAAAEGYSPGSSYHNYWGMGCTNTGGLSACIKYSSFMNGVEEYIKNISQYDSLASMMSKYAYIGDYWYNPGGSASGGCYYAEYIYTETNMPSRVKNACATGKECSGSSCVATTTADQLAYSTWQVEKMASIRESIFGLEGNESCTYTNTEGNNEEFIWPTISARITSYFGKRSSPTAGASTNHRGIDIGVPTGTDVYASASGVVTTVAYNSARGKYIIVDHGKGMETLYQHCDNIIASKGETVKQGQVIAESGNTGIGTGAHLHFEVHKNGTPVDPLDYVKPK